MRLVQGRERIELAEEGLEHAAIDPDRLGVLETAVNDPVAHANEMIVGELLPQESTEVLHRAVMAELLARAHDRSATVLPVPSFATNFGAV